MLFVSLKLTFFFFFLLLFLHYKGTKETTMLKLLLKPSICFRILGFDINMDIHDFEDFHKNRAHAANILLLLAEVPSGCV